MISFSKFNVVLLFLWFQSSDLSLSLSLPPPFHFLFFSLLSFFLCTILNFRCEFINECKFLSWGVLETTGTKERLVHFFGVRNDYRMYSTTFKWNHYRWGRKLCNEKGSDRNTCQKVMSTPKPRNFSPHVLATRDLCMWGSGVNEIRESETFLFVGSRAVLIAWIVDR